MVSPVVVAAAVGVVCWAQPLVDQESGEGNLATLATNWHKSVAPAQVRTTSVRRPTQLRVAAGVLE